MKKVAIIGAGPSGLMSIYSLLETKEKIEIFLFDEQDDIGKRIKISGNGRCNFFHNPIDYNHYSSPENAEKYFHLFLTKCKEIFSNLGLIYYEDNEGRMYPLSNSSKTLIYLFKIMLKNSNVNVHLNTKIKRITPNLNKINIETKDNIYAFDAVILATGGFSYLYNKDEKVQFLKDNNIAITKLTPSLTPIRTEKYFNKALEGKRFKVKLSLTYFDKLIFEENGEILLKKDGISGIVTFNLSALLARKHLDSYDNYLIHIDFASNYSFDKLKDIIYDKKFSIEDNLSRLFIKELKDELLLHKGKNILSLIKDFTLKIKELYTFKDSQVTSGGIDISLINEDFSLKNNPLVFPCGELLDIDGDSGGYNIAFCFASGYQVGKSVIDKLKKIDE